MRFKISQDNPFRELSKLGAFIGSPGCQAILQALASEEGCVRDKIISVSGMSRYTVLMNLRQLKKFGIINGNLQSKDFHYCLDYAKLEELKELFDRFYHTLIQTRESTNPLNKPCSISKTYGSN